MRAGPLAFPACHGSAGGFFYGCKRACAENRSFHERFELVARDAHVVDVGRALIQISSLTAMFIGKYPRWQMVQ